MKKILYLLVAMSLFHSCAKDDSSEVFPKDNPNFSHITISSDIKSLSVDYGQEFEFTPNVKQTIEGKALKYKWTANKYNLITNALDKQIILPEGMPLKYTFNELGDYKLRLEVQNEDYSEFMTWDLSVRAYDKGYFVVGTDESGNSNITFGRMLSEADIVEGKKLEFASNLIGEINSNITIKDVIYVSKSILEYGKTAAYVHIFTKEKIYAADANTFKIFYTANMANLYPNEYIKSVSIMDTYAGTAVIYTSKNRFLSYKKAEFGIFQQAMHGNKYFNTGYTNLISTSGNNMDNTEVGVDEVNSKIWTYVPYLSSGMVNNTSGTLEQGCVDELKPNDYIGYNIINVMRMNGDTYDGTPKNFFTIAQNKDNPNMVKLVEFSAGYPTAFTTLNVEQYTSAAPITYKKGMQMVPNARYSSVYYADGSKVYLWYPTNTTPNNRLPVQHTFDLGSGKEITTMSVSYDMRHLYVGFYDNNSSQTLKGGFYIYEAKNIGIEPNIQPIEKYENITTRPIQILYKSNTWDKYSSTN